jgi:hypothetical protein
MGKAVTLIWKLHTDGCSAVGTDGFSTVLWWAPSGFTLKYVQKHHSLGNAMT